MIKKSLVFLRCGEVSSSYFIVCIVFCCCFLVHMLLEKHLHSYIKKVRLQSPDTKRINRVSGNNTACTIFKSVMKKRPHIFRYNHVSGFRRIPLLWSLLHLFDLIKFSCTNFLIKMYIIR